MAVPQLLQGRGDRYNGILVDSTRETIPDGESFQDLLLNSILEWTKANKRGIWFKVHIKDAAWIPILVQNGFTYHHAKQDYVMLLNWLPKDESCNVPPFAHTMVGVGAVVINDNQEVLVVSEKYYDRAHWKLPGGYVEPGENFVDAAIREVYEETNIHTEFRSVLAFRHGHGGQFQCSDLYTVVSLKPLSTAVKKCEREIQDCKWMTLDEYLTHPDIHELNRLFVHKYLENAKCNMKIECSHGIHQVFKKPYTVYHAIGSSDDKEQTSKDVSNSAKSAYNL